MPPFFPALSEAITTSPLLIVDDEEISRTFIEHTLRARGFTHLIFVASGEEALKKLEEMPIDLVILDILMPGGIDGFACCTAIRLQPKFHDLPILIQTHIKDDERRVQAFTKGATDFVSKPVYPDELSARVLVHLEKRHSLKALRHYKERTALELENARKLQFDCLPKAEEISEIERRCHLDIASYFEPSSEVGGDLWGMKKEFPYQSAFWLVDFSGHGLASAMNAFRLHAYLKEQSDLSARPGAYLSSLNDKLLNLLPRGQFATMFYGILDSRGKNLFYACACSPPPILWRKETGKAELIDGSGSPLGISMQMYATQQVSFAPGDKLLLYSDALTETPNAAGDYMTEEQIMHLLEENSGASSGELKKILLDQFRQHARDALRDDLTLLILTQSGI